MISSSVYSHLEKVQEFSHSIIYRAQRKKDKLPVLIKEFKKEFEEDQISPIRRQLASIKKIKSPAISAITEYHTEDNKISIAYEDTGAMFLSVVLQDSPTDFMSFFPLALSISRNLGQLHQNQINHNDLCPHNILLDLKTGEVTFAGASFQKMTSRGRKRAVNPELFEIPYAYTSPEQTGRINWTVDQRSDLYAVGVMLYETICKRIPFQADDVNTMIHHHLATEPESILKYRQDAPVVVDQMIMKLLSKSPDDRYQSAFGLMQDLKNCQEQYSEEHRIEIFELGRQDNVDRFYIPSKLYGAERNINTLMESFNRVCSGSVEMMIIKGGAGIGKTSLVRELLGSVESKSGFLTQGRCEREYRDTPYYPLIKSFQTLVSRILSGDEADIERWRRRFKEAFARNGQLVIDFVPEMERIIGPQPPLPKVDPVESQNRLIYIFRRFMQAFSQENKPLVIFLDSFHWVDSATILLMQAALSDINSRYIQFVISYQEDHIIHAHTLSVALDEILKSGTHIQEITVLPLSLDDICRLIEEALSFKQDFESLAEHVLEITEGNPYFVKQILQYYHENKLIHFSSSRGKWVWNLGKIKNEKLTKEVADLLVRKIASLPLESVEIIKLASCIGNQFNIQLLAFLADSDVATVSALLSPLVRTGLIRPLSDSGEKSSQSDHQHDLDDLSLFSTFRFSHGKVVQAALSLLDNSERNSTHLKFGRLLIDNLPIEDMDRDTYRIVNQMNEGFDLIQARSERHELARLNLIAGNKSRSAAAFDTAWKYFSIGSNLLSEDCWETEYDLAKELYLKRSDCAYYIGSTQEAEPIFDDLLKHVKTNLEKVEVINLKLNLYIKNNMLDQAVEIGLEALKELFQEEIPPNEAEINIISQMQMQDIQFELEKKKIENLLFLPLMADDDKKALMELISNIIPAVHVTSKNLWIYLTLKMVENSLKFGNTDSSAYGYMNYAVILCSGLKDYESGYSMGVLALDLNEKFNNVQLVSQLNFLFGSYINHWKVRARDSIVYLKRSYQAGIEHGDYLSAANSINFLMRSLIMVGSPLEEVEKEAKKHQDFIEQLNNKELKSVVEISKLISLLKESPPNSTDYLPSEEHSRRLISKLVADQKPQNLQWYYLLLAQIHRQFYDNKKALTYILESDKIVGNFSHFAVPEHYFYHCLIILENYPQFSEDEKKRYWDLLKVSQQKLAELSQRCPNNFEDKSQLIAAIAAGVSGNFVQAVALYDEAIRLAKENGFVQNEAIANEAAAKYYMSRNQRTIATAFLREACQAYVKWGAQAKLKHLEQSYPDLLIKRRRFDDRADAINDAEESRNLFDLTEIVKASQSISGEMVQEKMVERLLSILMEGTRADKIYFIIDKEGELTITAEGLTDRDPQVGLCQIPLETSQNIAQSVVYYVIRTRKLVVLDDASKENMFSYNKYIREKKPRSILCMPVINHGRLAGIVYLENTIEIQAFSPNQIELLTILVSQVSISLENSMLFTNLAELTDQLSSSKVKLERRIEILEQELESKFL